MSEFCQLFHPRSFIFAFEITFMKRFSLIFFIAFFSCNDSKNDDAKNDQPVTQVSNESTMKDAILKNPDSLILRENLIQYYRDKGDYSNAIQEAEQAIKRDSLGPRFWDIKAVLHFENGDTVHAISAFEKAVAILPDPQYVISLGTLYAQTKNPLALAMADALLKADKSKADKEAFFIKGLYYSYTGEKMKAITFFDKALAESYTFMDAYLEKSIALYDLGKYEEALAVLDKAITLQNNFDAGYYYSGRCLEKLNRKEEAIQSFKNALVYDPDYAEAKQALQKLGAR